MYIYFIYKFIYIQLSSQIYFYSEFLFFCCFFLQFNTLYRCCLFHIFLSRTAGVLHIRPYDRMLVNSMVLQWKNLHATIKVKCGKNPRKSCQHYFLALRYTHTHIHVCFRFGFTLFLFVAGHLLFRFLFDVYLAWTFTDR